jgi:pyruvate carboxylase subunit B
VHQIPGGMTTNLVAQLRQMKALDKLGDVREETARVRAEFGYPPLVTPTSQIVGAQAVQNVLIGRYKLFSNEAREYISGGYGRPPAPIAPDVQKAVLNGKAPITRRPADLLEPELEKAREESKEFARNIQDVLTYALYPVTGARFLKYKYGIDRTIPDDWKPPRAPKTLEQVKKEDELISRVKAGRLKGT